jgi:hypothetical protein
VTHEELDRCTADRKLGTVRADSVLTTARELAEDVLIETTSSRVDELEVGRDKRQQGAEKQLDLHLDECVVCVMWMVIRELVRRAKMKMAQGKKVIVRLFGWWDVAGK